MNRALKILLSTNGFVLLAGAMFGPIYAVFVEEVGGDIMSAGLTGGVFALAAGVTTVISGRYSDKMKEPELIIVWGYVMMAVGFFLMIFVKSIWMLFAVQAFIGFAEAFYSPAFDSLYSKHLTKKKAGFQWGLWESINYFTAAAGAALGGLVAAFFGFHWLFAIMAAICVASALYILILPRKVL